MAIGNPGTTVDTKMYTATTLVIILSLVRGPHSLRAGAQIIYFWNDLVANNNRRGTIAFQSFNDFLSGSAGNSVYGDGIGTRNLRAADYSFFIQDDWKVSPRLTVNLGLRSSWIFPPYETRGAISTFDPSLYPTQTGSGHRR